MIVRVGSFVSTRYGISEVLRIVKPISADDPAAELSGHSVEEADTDTDKFVVDMANNHWAYEYQIQPMEEGHV